MPDLAIGHFGPCAILQVNSSSPSKAGVCPARVVLRDGRCREVQAAPAGSVRRGQVVC